MSNVNSLSLFIASMRGDGAARASILADEIFFAYSQRVQHGQSTPFINGIAACKGWKGPLGQAVESLLVDYASMANKQHASKAKLTADELESIKALTVQGVTDLFTAEAERVEAAKVEGKAKREAAKAEATKAEAAKQEEAALAELDNGKDLLIAQSSLSAAQGRIAELEAALSMSQARIAELEAALSAAQAVKLARKPKQAA
jgi:hypothetical protein